MAKSVATHHDIRVIDSDTARIRRVEGHRLVPEMRAEALERKWIGAVRARYVSEAVGMVEHHRTGSLEKDVVVLEA